MAKRVLVSLSLLAVVAVSTNIRPVHVTQALPDHSANWTTRVRGLPVPFVANEGQYDTRVKYYARLFDGTVFVTDQGECVYSLIEMKETNVVRGVALHECLLDGRIADVSGAGRTPTTINSFTGRDPSGWRSNIPTYDRVNLGEVYDGIAMELRAYGDNIEKIFLIEPHSDPGQIRVQVSGAENLTVAESGTLEAHTVHGTVVFSRPVAFQDIAGERVEIEVAYEAHGGEYGFRIGEYDDTRTLTIDPLLASTFLGGSCDEINYGPFIEVDEEGNVYLSGFTCSFAFPTSPGAFQDSYGGGQLDCFVAKFNNDLTVLMSSTFLGGSGFETECSIDLHQDGTVYVAGSTNSSDFPTTSGAYDESYNGAHEIFVARLDNDLATLLSSTYLGGSGDEGWVDQRTDIEVSSTGDVFIVGQSQSADFPTTIGAYDNSYNGGPSVGDFVVVKMNGDLSDVLASTFLGGSQDERRCTIWLDGDENVLISGQTESSDFPTTPGVYDLTFNGYADIFVARLTNDLTSLSASTFLGQTGDDMPFDIQTDVDGDIYVTGYTSSSGFISTHGAYDETHNGGEDGYIVKFNADLDTILAATFLGGEDADRCQAMTIGGNGDIYIAGKTLSANFPIVVGIYDDSYNGGSEHGDMFASVLDADLTTLHASTFLGGTADEKPFGIALDGDENIIIGGFTHSVDYPVTPNAYDRAFGGIRDVVVAKLCLNNDCDHDGWLNDVDNCPAEYNPDQEDGDSDGVGGACDNCPADYNPEQEDTDKDGVGDVCDVCPFDPLDDGDADGHCGDIDNCPEIYNPVQADADGDEIGDACDNCPTWYNPGQTDINENGIGDSCEVPEIWYVTSDGGGDAPTIQAAIDSCTHGDTVLIADGVYTGEGNRDIEFHGRRILVRGENGPQSTFIDCEGVGSTPRRGFAFTNGEDSSFIVAEITIRRGFGPVFNGSNSGGGVLCVSSAPTIRNCVFEGNTAVVGGALYAYQAAPRLINCTFIGNSAIYGSTIFAYNNSSVILENCLVAYNQGGLPVYCIEGSSANVTCSDIYGNAGGNWGGCIAGQELLNGNFSLDPLFCDTAASGYDLLVTSPCAVEHNDCEVWIGALGVGCYCDCGLPGDMDCDGMTNPIDVVYLVNFVYLSQDARCVLPGCPYYTGDANCDYQVNPVDVVYLVNAVYKNQNALCDGCAP